MLTLNLINPTKSSIKYELVTFSDGQPHIKIKGVPDDCWECKIITRLASAVDVLLLLFVTEVLKNNLRIERIELEISYLLTARMDRRMQDGEPTSLRVLAKLINDQEYAQVTVYDPHSSNTELLLDRCISTTNLNLINLSRQHIENEFEKNAKTMLVSPDAGSEKKMRALGGVLRRDVLYCSKERDSKTGALSKFVVPELEKGNETRALLVVDDLCDGGGTFIGLSAALREANYQGNLYLVVSHGIFGKGLEVLAPQYYSHIFTTNSFKEQEEHKNLTTLKLW